MKTAIVTTFSDAGYLEYGHWFVKSLKNFLDSNIHVYLYVDSVNPEHDSTNVTIRRLEPSVPELSEFKKRNQHRPVEKFLFDGVRFSHKSYCIWHCATHCDADRLFWLDSDTEFLDVVTEEYLNKFLPNDNFVCYLGREGQYTETGILGFDLKHPSSKDFFDRWKQYYDQDLIWNLDGQLDCHVFDAVLEEFVARGDIKGYNLVTPEIKKNHFNAVLSGYLIHYKGDHKQSRDRRYAKALRNKRSLENQ